MSNSIAGSGEPPGATGNRVHASERLVSFLPTAFQRRFTGD
ncbi:hypothetical protein ACNI65_13585 [Roseateles sp. So40a]